jgi:hypothetical protein
MMMGEVHAWRSLHQRSEIENDRGLTDDWPANPQRTCQVLCRYFFLRAAFFFVPFFFVPFLAAFLRFAIRNHLLEALTSSV